MNIYKESKVITHEEAKIVFDEMELSYCGRGGCCVSDELDEVKRWS